MDCKPIQDKSMTSAIPECPNKPPIYKAIPMMNTQTNQINSTSTPKCPRLEDNPLYKPAAEKLRFFMSEMAKAKSEIDTLNRKKQEIENKLHGIKSDPIAAADLMLSDGNQTVSVDEDIRRVLEKIRTLKLAIDEQNKVEANARTEASTKAAVFFLERHKKATEKIMFALQSLLEANAEEEAVRAEMNSLGYLGALPFLSFNPPGGDGLIDMSNEGGGYAFHWHRDAKDYVQSSGQWIDIERQRIEDDRAEYARQKAQQKMSALQAVQGLVY